MPLTDTLRSLLTAVGPSGREAAAAEAFRSAGRAFGAEVSGDVMGNSFVRVAGTGEGPTVAIIGHADEIGLIVTDVDDKGFLRFAGVGGWDPQVLVGQRVTVLGRDGALPGVVGRKPIHLLEQEQRKKVAELKEMHIDVGARDGDEARSLVRVGDVAVIAAEPVELPNGRVAARAMDNRLGCYVALEAARLVAEGGGAAGDVVAIAAVQEETQLAGAGPAAFGVRPDVAIIVDVTHATDAPGVDTAELGRHPLGGGPVVERGPVVHDALATLLLEAAEAEGIEVALEAHGRATGTDGDVVHRSRTGVPTALVSVPLRYMHSPVETVQLSDVDGAARLIAAFARRLPADASFVR
jgi:putative aminopeptidase FrvX